MVLHILDVLSLAIVTSLGFILRKKWQARSLMLASFCGSFIWCAYYRPSKWIGGVAPVLVDFATFGLAYMGGHVAISPPKEDDKTLKKVYVSSFVLLFVIGMAANGWQRSIESNKRDELQKDETEARQQFSQNLRDVKKSNEAILDFVAHPPRSFTKQQVSDFAKVLSENSHLDTNLIISNDALKVLANEVRGRLQGAWIGITENKERLYTSIIEAPKFARDGPKYDAVASLKKYEQAIQNLRSDFEKKVKDDLSIADTLYPLMLKRFGPDDLSTKSLGDFIQIAKNPKL